MVLGGYQNLSPTGFWQTPLADLLPVEPADVPRQIDRPFEFSLTPEGLAHPAMTLSGNSTEDAALWQALPPLAGIVGVGKAKPGAVVLARYPDAGNPTRRSAALATMRPAARSCSPTQSFGKGRVGLLAADTTWRWSRLVRLAGRSDAMYVRFWSQWVRWLAGRDVRSQADAPGDHDRQAGLPARRKSQRHGPPQSGGPRSRRVGRCHGVETFGADSRFRGGRTQGGRRQCRSRRLDGRIFSRARRPVSDRCQFDLGTTRAKPSPTPRPIFMCAAPIWNSTIRRPIRRPWQPSPGGPAACMPISTTRPRKIAGSRRCRRPNASTTKSKPSGFGTIRCCCWASSAC